jgi:hypothetical protein
MRFDGAASVQPSLNITQSVNAKNYETLQHSCGPARGARVQPSLNPTQSAVNAKKI